MKIFLPILLIVLLNETNAQVKPDFFPEEVDPDGIHVRCFCKPGVRNKSKSKGLKISYGWLGDGTFEPEDVTLNQPYSEFEKIQNFEFDMKVPLVIEDDLKILIGYKYFFEKYDFRLIGADYSDTFLELDQRKLKNNSFSFYMSKPLNETRYMGFRFRYSLNGNYKGWANFVNHYAIYKATAVYMIKPNPDLEWGFGLNASRSFRRMNLLPFFVYNRNFNSRWGVEAALPGFLFSRINVNEKNILLAGIEYDSQSYRVSVEDAANGPLDYALNHSEFLASMELEHQFSSWVWASFKFGYQMNFSSDFESKSLVTPDFKVEPTNAVFFRVTLFVSPPD